MAISPQQLRDTAFSTVRKNGFDPAQVEAFKQSAADALQQAIQDATAMEARARAAVAKLQELSQQRAAAAPAPDAATAPAAEPAPEPAVEAPRTPTVDESETISRTLLLAQRTADNTIAEAQAEATGIIETAKSESRRAGEAERVRVEGEVQALLARRDFLESDVDALEQHLAAQRERVGGIVAQLQGLASGLEPGRRPQLSASDHDIASDAPAGAGADDGADGADGSDDGADDSDDDVDVADLIDEVVETAEVDPDGSGEIARIAPAPDQQPPADPPRHTLFTTDQP